MQWSKQTTTLLSLILFYRGNIRKNMSVLVASFLKSDHYLSLSLNYYGITNSFPSHIFVLTSILWEISYVWCVIIRILIFGVVPELCYYSNFLRKNSSDVSKLTSKSIISLCPLMHQINIFTEYYGGPTCKYYNLITSWHSCMLSN